jgi:cytochrome c553
MLRYRNILPALLLAGVALLVPAAAALSDSPIAERDLELATALAAETDPLRGRQAYATCATCHGPDGAGRADGTFPQLAGQHASVIMKQLVDIRTGHRDNPLMLPYAQRLMDAQEIADVSAYLSTLPVPPDPGRGPGADLERGGELYRRDCSRCHGERAEGDAASFFPALSGQHYGYLLRQIRDIGAGRRRNAHPEMATLTRRYDDVELKALVDYAARLGRNRTPPAAEGERDDAP